MALPTHLINLHRILRLHQEAADNDAEALARMFEDRAILDDGTLGGRLEAILRATEHRWIRRLHIPLDIPGLQDCPGFSDRGFRPEFKDPWTCSGDQAGHFLTALGLILYPERLEGRRLGFRLRDLVGAPREMGLAEVALRFIVGHEKRPDPHRFDPLVLFGIRRQFASATLGDVEAFRAADAALGPGPAADLQRALPYLETIPLGEGRGNSRADLLLSFAGYRLARLIQGDQIRHREEIAAWIRRHLKAP